MVGAETGEAQQRRSVQRQRIQIKNMRRAGVTTRHVPARQYWTSPEGQRRKELRCLDKFAALPRDMTPRLVKTITGLSESKG